MNGRGFKQSPADYYNFAYWKKQPTLKRTASMRYCINGKPFHSIYMNQIKQFIDRMNSKQNQHQNFFSYNMFSSLTHDRFETPKGFDHALYAQLSELERQGFLDNTLLMILGDHGGRPYAYGDEMFSKFARFEYPNPFLSIKIPGKLRDTVFAKNFKSNTRKLITSFDLHKTLKQFYYLTRNGLKGDEKCRQLFSKSVSGVRALRGVSLFENVPQDRSCKDAMIPINFCACLEKKLIDEKLFLKETGDLSFKNASKFIMDTLNEHIEHLKKYCALYKYENITSVSRVNSMLDVRNFKSLVKRINKTRANYTEYKKLYEFSILVQPGAALFKTLLEVSETSPRFFLKSKLIRENSYGRTSSCLSGIDRDFKDACYCLKQDQS